MRLLGTEWGWMDDRGRLGWTCFCHGLRCLNILCNTHSYPCNEDRCSCACPWKCRIWRRRPCRGALHLNLSFVYTSLHLGPPHSKVFSCRSINQSINRIKLFHARSAAVSSRALHPYAIHASFAFSTRPSPPINTVASPARSFSRAVPRTEPPSSDMAIPAFDAVPITALPTGASPHFIPASTGLPQQIELTKWNRSH